MILQGDYPPTNVNINDIIKTTSGECYTYVGDYVNYIAPSGYIVSNINEFTATTATTYTTCIECLTPEPEVLPYNTWFGRGEYSISCPTCELTNYGTDITFFTTSADTTIQTGIYVYDSESLTSPLDITYIKYDGKIYEVSDNGLINEFCTVNNNC